MIVLHKKNHRKKHLSSSAYRTHFYLKKIPEQVLKTKLKILLLVLTAFHHKNHEKKFYKPVMWNPPLSV